jgi:hypothetical protein
METVLKILLASLAIIGVGGLIVGIVVWLGHRPSQQQADDAAEGDQQARRPIWRPGSNK